MKRNFGKCYVKRQDIAGCEDTENITESCKKENGLTHPHSIDNLIRIGIRMITRIKLCKKNSIQIYYKFAVLFRKK